MHAKILIFLNCCFSFALICFAQPPVSSTGLPLHIQSLTVEDGLPQGVITAMVQDKRGFIWLGTYNGLCRYDGREFRVFRHKRDEPASLTYNEIMSMSLDSSDRIWIYYQNHELDVFDTHNEQARHISREPAFHILRSANFSRFIRQIGDRLWAGTKDGIRIFDARSAAVEILQPPAGEAILSVGVDRKGQPWLATQLALYSIKNNAPVEVCKMPVSGGEPLWTPETDDPMGTIREDAHHQLVMPTPNGIFIYSLLSGDTTSVTRRYDPNFLPGTLGTQSGTIYFCLKDGVYELGMNGHVQKIWTRPPLQHRALAMMMDASDVLWWADQAGYGVHLIDLHTPPFRSYPYQTGFSHDPFVPYFDFIQTRRYVNEEPYLTRCARDAAGNIWLRTANSYLSPDGKRVQDVGLYLMRDRHFEPVKFRSSYPCTFSQISFTSGQCWLVVIRDDFTIKLVRTDSGYTSLKDVLDLKRWDPGNQNYYLSAAGSDIYYSDGKELLVYNTLTRRSLTYSSVLLANGSAILMTLPDRQNKDLLWIATYGAGIVKLHLSTGKAESLTEKEGLPDHTVYYMAADKRGYFWCSSNKGIFRMDPRSNSVVSFTAKDGLQGSEFNRYHFFETPDGHFIFGGTKGYTLFHPDSIEADRYPTPAAITGIKINNSDLGSLPGWKDSCISNLRALTLEYNQNFLSFHFAGLQFNNPAKLRYRYKLSSFDHGWQEQGNLATATYTNIPPGKYNLLVNASNTSGIWSTNTATLAITVLPPWWKTWWAYFLYVTVLSAILYAFYTGWKQRVQIRQEIMLKEKESMQLKAVDEMKARFFSNITHEFRTPLTLIIAPLQDLQNNAGVPPAVKSTLSVVTRNAQQLQQLINQLLDLNKLESGTEKISLGRGEVALFIYDCVQSFAPYAQTRQVEIHFDEPAREGEHEFDAGKLRKIVNNLVSNAIKFSGTGAAVHITVQMTKLDEASDNFRLSVSDTGMGIPPEKLPFLFNRFYQADDSTTRVHEGSGIGLALVKELTELMGGRVQVESREGAGSDFVVTLPLHKAGHQTLPAIQEQEVKPVIASVETDEIPATQPEGSGQGVIMVVEDNRDLRDFIVSVLAPLYRVWTAENGADGLLLAQQQLPDLIISDVMMPRMDGFQFCFEIKNDPSTDHIIFILLTAKTSQLNLMKGLQSSADEYIPKPFHVDELLLRISNLLERKEKLKAFLQKQLSTPSPVNKEHPVIETPFFKNLQTSVEELLSDKSFSVEKLARKLAVSERSLYRKLESEVGLTPNEFIRQYRLKKAAGLLLQGVSITDAAYQAGYETVSWFSTSFKNFYHITPSEFVAQNTKNLNGTKS